MAAREKMSKLLSFFRTFLTSFMVTTISSDRFDGGFWSVHKRREEAGIPFWRSMLANPTISKFPLHSVCHICASQIFIYEILGNYLKILSTIRPEVHDKTGTFFWGITQCFKDKTQLLSLLRGSLLILEVV